MGGGGASFTCSTAESGGKLDGDLGVRLTESRECGVIKVVQCFVSCTAPIRMPKSSAITATRRPAYGSQVVIQVHTINPLPTAPSVMCVHRVHLVACVCMCVHVCVCACVCVCMYSVCVCVC